jgi:hypothetical protein
MSYRALYYPFIHFRDPTWLKAATLYWDQIGRIVPTGDYELRDTPEVESLRARGIVTEFLPGDSALEVGESFEALITDQLGALRAAYSIDQVEEWDIDKHTSLAAPEAVEPRFAYLHRDTINTDLADLLLASGLASNQERLQEGWLGMHPRLVQVYMTALAETMRSAHGAHPITNQATHAVSVAGLETDRLAQALLPEAIPKQPVRSDREIEQAMVTVSLEAVVPGMLAKLEMDEVIELREKQQPLRRTFQDEIRHITDELSGLDTVTPEALRWHLESEHEARIEPALENLRQSLRDSKISVGKALLSTDFVMPAGVSGILELLGVAIVPPIGVAAGLAWATWGAWQSKRSNERTLMAGDWTAFLLETQKSVDPVEHAASIGRAARALQPPAAP